MAMQAPDGQVGAPLESKDLAGLSTDELKKRIEEGTRIPPELIELFTYHKATPQQEESYKLIRHCALQLAKVINDHCPAGPDRTAAVRKIREAVMTANASIATNNAQYR